MSDPRPTCPSCQQTGQAVPVETVRRLSATAPDWEQAWLCKSPPCGVVYFSWRDEHIDKPDVRVVVFHKDTNVSRPVCYCFGHSVADVLDANADDGSNRIVEEITAACRRGLDRCEHENPQGRCCLGNVRQLLRHKDTSSDDPGCCSS